MNHSEPFRDSNAIIRQRQLGIVQVARTRLASRNFGEQLQLSGNMNHLCLQPSSLPPRLPTSERSVKAGAATLQRAGPIERQPREENRPGSFFVDHTCIDCDTCRSPTLCSAHATASRPPYTASLAPRSCITAWLAGARPGRGRQCKCEQAGYYET